jgi:type III pantothenate kinase
MKLLIDSGNTRLKWATFDDGVLAEVKAVVHESTNVLSQLQKEWAKLAHPESIYISCVNGSQSQLKSFLLNLWPNNKLTFVQSSVMSHGVINAYPQPDKLGVDRWLAMIAAKKEYQAPLCIVDCGTAITLDCIDAQGQHLGGMIMPGWSLMQQALHTETANLKFSNANYTKGLANQTQAAIFNGRLTAIQGFIKAGMKGSEQLILTGGDAKFIHQALALTAILDLKLVFKGLVLEAI